MLNPDQLAKRRGLESSRMTINVEKNCRFITRPIAKRHKNSENIFLHVNGGRYNTQWVLITSDLITVIGFSLCIGIPNFIQIGSPSGELWCHIEIQDGGRSGGFTSGFGLGDVALFKSSTISKPNFGATENAGLENDGPNHKVWKCRTKSQGLKMQDHKMRDWKMTD